MATRFYTVLGWIIWRALIRGAREELNRNRVKLGAVAVVAAVVFGGIAAARSESD